MFKNKTYVGVREYYGDAGDLKPGSKVGGGCRLIFVARVQVCFVTSDELRTAVTKRLKRYFPVFYNLTPKTLIACLLGPDNVY